LIVFIFLHNGQIYLRIPLKRSYFTGDIYFQRYQYRFLPLFVTLPPQLLGVNTINMTTELTFIKNNLGFFGSLMQSVAYPIRGNIHTAEETGTL